MSTFRSNSWQNMGHIRTFTHKWGVHKNCNFFQFLSTLQYNLYWKGLISWDICAQMWNHWAKRFVQKIAIFFNFLRKIAQIRGFWAFSAQIMAHMRDICGFGNVQKIAIFFKFGPIFSTNSIVKCWKHGTYAGDVLICEATWGCTKIAIFFKKLTFFWAKVTKIEEKQGFRLFSRHICGRYAGSTRCTKIAKNSHFFGKSSEFPRNWAILAEIMGQYRQVACAQKLQFFSISGPFCIEFVLELPQNMGH